MANAKSEGRHLVTPQTYHYRPLWIGLRLIQSIVGFAGVIAVFAFLYVIAPSSANDFERQPVLWLVVCMSVVSCLVAIAVVPSSLLIAGNALFSCLRMSPEGVEYRSWPSYGVRCMWVDIEGLRTRRISGLFRSEELLLRHAEPVGPQITRTLRRVLGLTIQDLIPLTNLQGWPEGPLSEQLRHYAPSIFYKPNA